MFRKNKQTPTPVQAPSAEEAEPVFTPQSKPVEEALLPNPEVERLALTERCGELAAQSAAAFHRELAEARARGLSTEDQAEYLKSLWAERKIPRIIPKGLRNHSTGLSVVKPDKVDMVTFYGLEDANERSLEASSSIPTVDRDFDRFPEVQTPEDEPVMFLGDLDGYFAGNINPGFMPSATPESVERLQQVAAVLEEASVLDINQQQQ